MADPLKLRRLLALLACVLWCAALFVPALAIDPNEPVAGAYVFWTGLQGLVRFSPILSIAVLGNAVVLSAMTRTTARDHRPNLRLDIALSAVALASLVVVILTWRWRVGAFLWTASLILATTAHFAVREHDEAALNALATHASASPPAATGQLRERFAAAARDPRS